MPYIAQTRTDIPNGVLQVLDLWPYTSQRSIYDPPGQTKYVNRGEYTGAGLGSARPTTIAAVGHVTTYACYGMAAYIADTIEDVAGGALTFFSAADANTAATNIAAVVDAGTALTAVVVSAILNAISAGSGLVGAGTSTGTINGVLRIAAGGSYLLPAGSSETTVAATMGNGAFEDGTYRTTAAGMALASSFSSGALASFVSASFDYDGTMGQALVVYADDGSLYT
jgi:hypothetical protein